MVYKVHGHPGVVKTGEVVVDAEGGVRMKSIAKGYVLESGDSVFFWILCRGVSGVAGGLSFLLVCVLGYSGFTHEACLRTRE